MNTKRPVFEEVTSGERTAAGPVAGGGPAREPSRKAIAAWLWSLAGLVACTVLVGGLTRLTDSGLAITVWEPVMGIVPPLSAADWDAAFAAYRETAEFRQQNFWMTLADFRPIFWWEWGHRFLGRLVGLVWLAGFLWFLLRRRIPGGWTVRLLLPGALGGLQGATGWWMVASGLDGLDVAAPFLAAHLGLAVLILMLLAWFALKVRLDEVESLKARRRRLPGLLGPGGAVTGLLFLQILSGALVAGIDAGGVYPEWPLMGGAFLPEGSFGLRPVWVNFFENPALVQFTHRMLGYLTGLAALVFALRALRAPMAAMRRWGGLVGLAALAQIALGIVTVLHAAALETAILHQAGALVLVALAIRAKFEAAYPAEQRIAR